MALYSAEDAKYLKRRIRGGQLDVHPTEKALIVNYSIEATVLDEYQNTMIGDQKDAQKVIRVKSLGPSTDLRALAREVVNRCKLIHPSKTSEVEQLLFYLQNRRDTNLTGDSAAAAANQSQKPLTDELEQPSIDTQINETASLNDIDDYAEMLYESMQEKIRGSALILQLARNPDNLSEIIQKESVLNVLTRVYKEESHESIELATNIVYIFFCFSSFTDFHPIVSQCRIGAQTMTVIEAEMKKYDQWMEEIAREQKKKQREPRTNLTVEPKYKALIRKQEQFLRVAFYLLLNLAEDLKVELKMRNKAIILQLIHALDRDNNDLLILVVSFLKKLSLFVENKNDMRDHKLVMKVARLIPCPQADLLNITLRLLLNLSFDRDIRAQIVRIGLLPKLVDLIDDDNQRLMSLCLLYHLSMDDRTKAYFTYTKCNQQLMKLIVDCKEDSLEPEVIALAVNLALNPGCAEQLCDYKHGKGLKLLLKRAYKYKDPLLMKMIRNISSHASPDIKNQFTAFVGPFGESIASETNDAFLTEIVGTLANLTIPDIDYQALMDEYGLVKWIKSKLTPDLADEDLTLNVVVLVGTLCADDACAEVLARSDIIQILIELLHARQENDEIVLQICYVFYQLCFHRSTRNVIIKKTEAPAYLIDLMQDKNKEVRRVCDMTLEIISECDPEWANRIKIARFRNHNQAWVEAIEGQQVAYDDEDDPSAAGHADPYGYNPTTPGDQDEFLDQFGYTDPDGYPFDGRESPDVNHWNSLNSGIDMDIDSKPFSRPEPASNAPRHTNGSGMNHTTVRRRDPYN